MEFCKKIKVDEGRSVPTILFGLVEEFDKNVVVTTKKNKYKFRREQVLSISDTDKLFERD